MKAPASDPGLTFDWPRREGFPFILFGCVAASLVAHAATFFLFQVADPLRTSLPPSAPQVSVLTPSSPEAIALLHWIDAQDPALVAAANSVTPPGLFDLAYRPSYEKNPAPLGPVEQPVTVAFPPARDPLAIITSADAKPAPPPTVSQPHPTTISFSTARAARAQMPLPQIPLKTRATEPVEPTRHLIGITDRGEVRFIFLQNSSGNPALDDQAAAHLQMLAFTPIDAPITWATATVTWGDDAYGEKPSAK
jgi:hypothetical protein